MKTRMLLLVILLAILTLGAVSASEDVSDDLAVCDNPQDSVGESCAGEILEDTDSGFKSAPEAEIASDDVNIKENATDNAILQSSEDESLADPSYTSFF